MATVIYLCITGLKSVPSTEHHWDLGVSQKTAWGMLGRVLESWMFNANHDEQRFFGPLGADGTYIGGEAKTMHATKQRQLTNHSLVKKWPLSASRITQLETSEWRDLQTRPVGRYAILSGQRLRQRPGFTPMMNRPAVPHKAVKHSVGTSVRGMAHAKGMGSL